MKFIKFIALTIAMSFTFSNAAFAQSKVLVLDYNKVINDSQVGKSIKGQLEVISKTMQNEVTVKLKNLEGESKTLQTSTRGLTMEDLKSRPDLTQKIKTFGEKQQKTKLDMQYKNAELNQTKNKALSEVHKKMKTIIDAIARERGADLIVDTGSAYYSSSSVDITATVMSRLNSQMPRHTVIRERITRKAQ